MDRKKKLDDMIGKKSEDYIKKVQPGTPFDMEKRVKDISVEPINNIIVVFDAKVLSNEAFNFLTTLPKVLADSGEIGEMEHDIFKIFISPTPDCVQTKCV